MAEVDDVLARSMREANDVFERMRVAVEQQMGRGGASLDVLEIARGAGLEIDERTLQELKIDPRIHPMPWLPWYIWWPWRPLWCWWWQRRYPWYRCCGWWWERCYWHPW
jgi:hypothetical protein